MKINFRKIRPSEKKLYRAIRLESLKNHPNAFGSTYEEQVNRKELSFEKHIEEQSKNRFIIGAFDKRKIVGICGIYQNTHAFTLHRAFIVQMYVKPEYSGNKIGLNLLKTITEESLKIPEVEKIELEVFTDMIAANKVYEQAGYQEVTVIKNYYKKEGLYRDIRLMTYPPLK